jgi:alkaline phosphatase
MRLRLKSAFAVVICLLLIFLSACSAPSAPQASESAPSVSEEPAIQEIGLPAHTKAPSAPKYVFLFIGDGMSFAQVNAAQIYKNCGNEKGPAIGSLSFTQFPVTGMATTFDETSVCPDSASSATALACGIKTKSGLLGMSGDKMTVTESIAEIFKEDGKKIGIISTVSINNATPAAFYAHAESRGDFYEIASQMVDSGVDYFGGGSLADPTGSDSDQENVLDMLAQNGYTIADSKDEIAALGSSPGKVYAVSPALIGKGAMPFSLDAANGDLTLADFVRKGIDVLYNEDGFFMVCESGKIDWACHANDAMTAISETLVLEDAVLEAVDFAKEHPDETLILVTGDHETGGMAIGNATTGYDTNFSLLSGQTLSYSAFDTLFEDMKKANPQLLMSDVLPVIKESFGLISPDDADAALKQNAGRVLTADEYERLAEALSASLYGLSGVADAQLLYGGYEPLTVTLTHILNNKAGIGWTTYVHTGGLVPVYAYGAGAQAFSGSYDNTDIFKKLVDVCGL